MNKDEQWYIYMIGTAHNTIYTGITTDVSRRFEEHCEGKVGAKYLRGKAPLTLLFSSVVGTRSEASRMEYLVKKLPRKAKEGIITGTRQLPLLS